MTLHVRHLEWWLPQRKRLQKHSLLFYHTKGLKWATKQYITFNFRQSIYLPLIFRVKNVRIIMSSESDMKHTP